MRTWGLIAAAVEAHGSRVWVAVTATEGSAPRDAGAQLIVTPEGFHGSIGGGTLEWRAIAAAQALLGKGPAARVTSHALGPELGQCCGGRVELTTEAFDLSQLTMLAGRAAREAAAGDDRRRLYLFGAGHVGRALVLALAPLPFDIRWVDARPGAFPRAVPGNVTPLAAGDPASALADAPEGSLVLVMTHSHALDLAVTDAALRHPGIAHVGLIGSATKRARFEKRLREAGVDAGRIDGLICPIGIVEIRSKEPATIAAATAAQVIILHERLSNSVIPAKAGTHGGHAGETSGFSPVAGWVPAFAGMTMGGSSRSSKGGKP